MSEEIYEDESGSDSLGAHIACAFGKTPVSCDLKRAEIMPRTEARDSKTCFAATGLPKSCVVAVNEDARLCAENSFVVRCVKAPSVTCLFPVSGIRDLCSKPWNYVRKGDLDENLLRELRVAEKTRTSSEIIAKAEGVNKHLQVDDDVFVVRIVDNLRKAQTSGTGCGIKQYVCSPDAKERLFERRYPGDPIAAAMCGFSSELGEEGTVGLYAEEIHVNKRMRFLSASGDVGKTFSTFKKKYYVLVHCGAGGEAEDAFKDMCSPLSLTEYEKRGVMEIPTVGDLAKSGFYAELLNRCVRNARRLAWKYALSTGLVIPTCDAPNPAVNLCFADEKLKRALAAKREYEKTRRDCATWGESWSERVRSVARSCDTSTSSSCSEDDEAPGLLLMEDSSVGHAPECRECFVQYEDVVRTTSCPMTDCEPSLVHEVSRQQGWRDAYHDASQPQKPRVLIYVRTVPVKWYVSNAKDGNFGPAKAKIIMKLPNMLGYCVTKFVSKDSVYSLRDREKRTGPASVCCDLTLCRTELPKDRLCGPKTVGELLERLKRTKKKVRGPLDLDPKACRIMDAYEPNFDANRCCDEPYDRRRNLAAKRRALGLASESSCDDQDSFASLSRSACEESCELQSECEETSASQCDSMESCPSYSSCEESDDLEERACPSSKAKLTKLLCEKVADNSSWYPQRAEVDKYAELCSRTYQLPSDWKQDCLLGDACGRIVRDINPSHCDLEKPAHINVDKSVRAVVARAFSPEKNYVMGSGCGETQSCAVKALTMVLTKPASVPLPEIQVKQHWPVSCVSSVPVDRGSVERARKVVRLAMKKK